MKMGARFVALAATLLAACSSGEGGGGGLKIVARGGNGTTGGGGSGGYFEAYAYTGADLRVTRSGKASPKIEMHYVKPDLGAHPLTVSENATVKPDVSNQVFGDDGEVATGIWVKPGATLTLEPYTGDTVYVNVTKGIYLQGKLTSTRLLDGTSAANVDFSAQNFVATTGAVVDLSGVANDEGDGGTGGDLTIDIDGTIVSGARYDLSGGDGNLGGGGGDLDLRSYVYGLWFDGDVDVSGGAGSNNMGGDGGGVALYGSAGSSSWGGAFVRGDFLLRGGAGASGGGSGGNFYVTGYYNGSTHFSGSVDASGGNGTDPVQNANGGDGGEVGSDTYTGDAVFAGRWVSRGGTGVGETGNGGVGGDMYVESYDDDQVFGGLTTGVLKVSLDVDVSGGNGVTGGDAGDTYFELDPDYVRVPGAATTELLGYDTIDISGGHGAYGGDAGEAWVLNKKASTYGAAGTAMVGGIRFEPTLVVRGGDGNDGAGGWGGYVEIATPYVNPSSGDNDASMPSYDREVVVSGDIDTSGGSGSAQGGSAGDVLLFEHFALEASGAITAKGGAGGTSDGGWGGDVQVVGDTLVKRSGSTTTAGGASAEVNGGWAGSYSVWGFRASASGNVDASGGVASAAVGGQGGFVDVFSTGQATPFGGSVNVSGGAGATAGDVGVCQIDGVQVALTSGKYTR